MIPPGAQTFGLTVADSVTPKDCAPPSVPDSGDFRPASLRSVCAVNHDLHPPLIRFTAAPFRSRNSPETGRALRQPAPACLAIATRRRTPKISNL